MKNKAQTQQFSTSAVRCYFYTNAIFMGLAKSKTRIGTGIILYHHGVCAIVSYNQNTQLNGHCIFYNKRSIISAKYNRNKLISVAYRIDGFLLYLKYNEQSKLHGNCIIVSFLQRTVYQIKYEEGYAKMKTKLKNVEKNSIEDVFIYNAYHLVIDQEHSRAMNHEISGADIKNIRMRKLGNKIQVFYGEHENKRTNIELGFQFVFRNPEEGGYNMETNRFKDEFQLNIVQKGLYKDGIIDGYGLRIFKNNNVYEGYFRHNVFHGEGALKNNQKGNWVYGIFENGEMVDVLDFSNDNNQQPKFKILLQNLRRSESNFVNQMVQQNNFDFLDAQIEKICARTSVQQYKIQSFQDRKLEIMKKITSQFLSDNATNQNAFSNQVPILKAKISPLKEQNTSQNLKTPEKKSQYIIRSFIPQSMQFNKHFLIPQNQLNTPKGKYHQTTNIRSQKSLLKSDFSLNQKNKKLSKIFNKDYSHLDQQRSKFTITESNSDLIKLHKVEGKSKIRKSQIFSPRQNNQNSITQFSLGKSRSPQIFTQRDKYQISNGSSPFKRRSPIRKTTIFESTIKLKKDSLSKNDKQKNDSGDQQSSTIQKLQSIRKGSIDKKSLSKSRTKRTQKIFDQQKQKQSPVIGKFIYVYENENNNDIKQKKQLNKKYSIQSQSPLLKSSKLTMSKI